jgi:hypothetical protein
VHLVSPRLEEGKAKLAELDDIVLVVERLVSEGELRAKEGRSNQRSDDRIIGSHSHSYYEELRADRQRACV